MRSGEWGIVEGGRAATRVMVFLSDDDRHAHHGLHEELLRRAHEAGIAGATVWRGIEGFGPSGRVRSTRLPDSTSGLPVVVELIDGSEAVSRFLATVRELAPGSLVTTEQITVYQHAPPARPATS